MSHEKAIQKLILRADVAMNELQSIREELGRLYAPVPKKKKVSVLTSEEIARVIGNRRKNILRSISNHKP